MPTSKVRSPEGVSYTVTHPEGATEEEILNYARRSFEPPLERVSEEEQLPLSMDLLRNLEQGMLPSQQPIITTPPPQTSQEELDLQKQAEEQSFLREWADIPIQIGSGALSAGEMISEVFGADNVVARQLEKANEYTRDFLSAQSKLDSREMQRIMEEAQDEGIWDQVKAGARAFSVAPLDISAQALGTAVPAIAGGIAGAAARAAPYAVTGIQAGIGSLMGSGLIKGTIYDGVQRALLEAGVSEEEANKAASEAQAYTGPNQDMIIAGVVLGALASTGPVEKLAQAGLVKTVFNKIAANTGMVGVKKAGEAATQATLFGGAKNIITAGLSESGYEFAQGAQEQLAENLALQRLGEEYEQMKLRNPAYYNPRLEELAKTPLTRGIGTSGALEGLGGFGVASGLATPFEVEKYIDQLQRSKQISEGLDALETDGIEIDPLRDVDVTEEEEAKLRQQEEARRQRLAIPREEEDVTSRLDGDDAVDMLSDEEADPLKLELTDPSQEKEVLSQDVGELIEGLPESDTEGSLPDGSPKIEVVNKAIQDVISIVKQGHTLEYGPRQEAQRKAVEEVMGEEAASLYEKTVKERMSYVNSLRGKSSSEMLKNWAKRSAKRISRGLRTHFPQNETFSIEQRGPEIVVVDKSGKVYGKVSTANRDPNEAFELANGLAAELNVESKRRADEWKRTGQPYDPVDTIRVRGEDVSPRDVTGLPKKPKKKNYKNPKYTERQYRVASVMSKVTGEMPARIELEGRSSPMSDKAFEDLTKRINDETTQRLQEQAQKPETPPLRLEEDKFRKKIRSKIKKVLSGRGLDNIGVVLADELFNITFDEDGNPIVDLSEEARRRVTQEGAEAPIGAYKKGPKNAEVIALALKTISENLGKNPTKKQIIEEILNVLNHETVHALRINDLFTENEWKLLSKLAANRKDTPYGMTYLERSRQINPELAARGQEDLLNEEAIAEMIKDGLRTDADGNPVLRKNWGGKPRSLFNRVYEFFKGLLGLRKDIGFETFDAILTGIEEGAVGSRERGVIRTRRAALKEEDRKEAKRRRERPETIPDEPEIAQAAALSEEQDRAEDFDPDAVQVVDRPAFARRPIETIENQIRESEAKLYRLNSEMRNDGPNYTPRKANQKSREIQKEEELLADLNAELELNQLRSESVFPDDVGEISYARGPQKPKKTRKAYKLFKVGRAKAGPNKGQPALFPLYIAQKSMPNGLPIGEWMRAEMGEAARDDKGNIIRDSRGRIKVKSLIGRLAFRPGWHAAILPFARHIGNKITNGIFDSTLKLPTSRKPNEVWAEVEFGVDKDYSAELERQGGEIRDRVPMLGSYEFNTNNAAEGVWLIGGDMKINKILSDEEVEAINKEAGSYDLPRLRPKTKYVQRIQDMEAERSYEKSLDDPASFARRLTGMPESYTVDGQSVEFGFFEPALNAAEEYAAESGIDYSGMENFAPLDPERASKIAVEYELMRHAPDDPLVKAAYNALIDETNAQFRKMLDTGLTIRFIKGEDPYGNPRNAILDVINNNNMFVFSTRDGFGSDDAVAESLKDNPLLQETEFVTADGEPMLANDVFRAVHDYFGHIKDGVGFRARGEENAWQSHAAMYSPLAIRALTTETRGQNSWVNYGPHGEFNRTASPAETIYADQKIGLLPLWVSLEGRLSDERYKSDVVGERYTDGLQGAIGSDGLLELSHYSNKKVYRNQPKLAGTGADKWTNNRPEKATWFGIVKADEDGFRIEKDKAVSSTHENIFKVDPKLLYRWYDPNLDTTKMENDPEGLIARWPAGNINFEKTFENLNNAGYIGFWANQKSGYGKYAVINTPLLSQDYTDKVNYDTLRELAELDDDIAFSRPIKLTGFPDEFAGDRRRSFLSASGELHTLTRDTEMLADDEGKILRYKKDDPFVDPPRYLEGDIRLKKKGKRERAKVLARQKDFLELPYDEGFKLYMELIKRARKQGFNTDIIFYHGTMATQPIRRFDPRKGDTREEEGMLTGREKQTDLGRQVAAHFTYELDWAEDWSIKELPIHRDKGRPQVYPVYLRLENIFDSRNPEGLFTELAPYINQVIEDAYSEIYERNNFNKEEFIRKMGGNRSQRFEEIESTKAFEEFVRLIASKSKLAQSIAFKESERARRPHFNMELVSNSDIMPFIRENIWRRDEFDPSRMSFEPGFSLGSAFPIAEIWYEMYARSPISRAVGISKYGSGFTDPRVEINKKTLPKFPKNPLNRIEPSDGFGFRKLEELSFAIHDAGFGGYVDFENEDGRPNGVGIYNSKDIKGIFADFDPEAVPEGMEYEDDIMFSRGFNDRVQTSIPFRQRTIKGVVQPIEFTIGDAEDFIIGLDRARQDPKGVLIGKLAKATRNYNFLSDEIKALDDEAVLDAFKQHMIDNLIYLYNEMSPEVREIAKRWYDGARKLSDAWAQRYEIEPRQVAAVIANLSPQKDWFMNMSLAERLLDIMSYRQDYKADKAMNDAFKRIVLYTEKGKRILAKDLKKEAKTAKAIWSKIKDKKLSEVQDVVPMDQINLAEAIWVRMYDEAHNPRAYRKMSPDGKILDFQRKQNGEKADVAWGSFTEIAKGVIAAKTSDLEKISISLGKMHKVRNFYNNIVAPNSKFGEVTIDTHAVAAALLKPLSSKSYEVAHNFGSTPSKKVVGMPENVKREGAGGSGVAGSLGTYPIIADAYRDAASQLGILPRQLQSITWEQVRTLFPVSFKDEEGNNLAKINKLWDNYASGDISLSDLREEIYGYTKTRENKPTWTRRSDAGSDVSRGAETYDRQLSSRELPRQGRRRLEERSRGDVDDTPPAYSRRPRDLATPEQLEENAAKNLEAAEKSQGRYVPRVNVNASLEAQYIANNPDAAATLDESEEAYFSRANKPKDVPEKVSKAVDDLTGDPSIPESPSETLFRIFDMRSGEKLAYNIDRFRRRVVDKYARLARYYKRNPHLYKMLADTSAVDAAMLSERATQFLAQTVTKGVITYDLDGNGTTMVVPFERDGRKIEGLLGVMKGLYPDPKTNPHGNLENLAQAYAILKRSERLKAQGKAVPNTDVTLEELEAEIAQYIDPTTGENIIERWYADWMAFNEYTITFMQNTGILDAETAQLWKDYSDFVPFYRQAENDPDVINKDYKVYAQKVFGGMANIPKLQELKGSEKKVTVPLLDAVYMNLAAAIQMGMKNVAAQRITRDMLSLGLAQKKTEAEAGAGYTVKFKHKGKTQTYEILDPLIYESMQASNLNISAIYQTIFGTPANFLREAITRMPPFWGTNLFRDSLSSFVTAGADYKPLLGALNMVKSTEDLEMLGVVGGYGLDVDRGLGLSRQFAKLRKKKGIYLEGEEPSVFDILMKVWDGLEVGSNRSEAAVRRQVFEDTLKRTGNIAEAQKQAIEVLNFARRGDSPVMKYLTISIPFLNARIQGLDLVSRALGGSTMPADRRSRSVAMMGTYTKAAILVATTLLYYMTVRDDEQYEEQTEMDKNLYYFIPTESGRPVRLPIPFEIGLIFKTIPELIMRLSDESVTPREAATNLGSQTLETFSVTPPQIVKPLFEVWMNKNLFTGRPIEPYYMDRQMKEAFKERPTTNELAKLISRDMGLSRIGLSPLDVEHLMSGYGGTLGIYAMSAVDAIMRSEAFVGDKTLIKPYEDFRDNAAARRFFGKRYPSGTLERYYDLQKRVDQIVGSINAAQDPEEREKRSAGRRGMLQAVRKSKSPDPSLADIKEAVKDFRDKIRYIGEQDIDAEEKAERIDDVKKQRTKYLNTYMPMVIEKYGLETPLIDSIYIDDEAEIQADLERAKQVSSGRGAVYRSRVNRRISP